MWQNLPVEILHSIFEAVESKKALHQCLLVCKKWKAPAEYNFYSSVHCTSFLTFKRFGDSISDNKRTAYSVKTLHLDFTDYESKSTYELYAYDTLFHLKNLQHLQTAVAPCYAQLLKVLIDSELPNLKMITSPVNLEDWRIYTNCVLIAKDSLEKLYLSDGEEFQGFSSSDTLDYNRLRHNLPKFKYLNVIRIRLKTGESLRELDAIIDSCSQSLHSISFKFLEGDNGRIDITEDELLECLPRPSIINGSAKLSSNLIDRNFFPYIRQKFPKLQSLDITLNATTLDRIQVMYQASIALSWVKQLFVNTAFATPAEICDSIHLLSESEKPKLLKNVRIHYLDATLVSPQLHLQGGSALSTFLTIIYSISNYRHLSFLERFGKDIQVLHLNHSKRIASGNMGIGQILYHLFEYCTSLKQLRLEDCNIDEEGTQIGSKLKTLQYLAIHDSEVHQSTFESLFNGVTLFGGLTFHNVQFFNYTGEASYFIYLGLTNAVIKVLSVDLSACTPTEAKASRFIFFNIYVEKPDKHVSRAPIDFYYKYDFKTMNDGIFKIIEAEEFYDDDYNDYIHFGIGCKSINQAKISYNKCNVVVPIFTHKRKLHSK